MNEECADIRIVIESAGDQKPGKGEEDRHSEEAEGLVQFETFRPQWEHVGHQNRHDTDATPTIEHRKARHAVGMFGGCLGGGAHGLKMGEGVRLLPVYNAFLRRWLQCLAVDGG